MAGRVKKVTQVESDRLQRLGVVQSAVNVLFNNDVIAAETWLTQPVFGLGDRAPVDMLSTELETQTVLELIGRLEHGVVT